MKSDGARSPGLAGVQNASLFQLVTQFCSLCFYSAGSPVINGLFFKKSIYYMVLTLTTVLLNSRRDKPFKVNKCHQINNSHRCSGVLVSFLFSPDALVSMNSCRLKIHIRTTSVMEVFGCMYVSVNLNMCFFSMSKQMSAFASVRVTCVFVYAFTNVQSQGLHFTFNSLSFPTPSPC